MAVRATFTGFDQYKLIGVKVTDQELGHGSYATVLQLDYMGLKCAGKKIHELLLRQGDTSYTVRRFEEECRLLSQVRHPNIVQFLGVHFQERVPAPILVMEFLPTNLTSCIEQYGILPKEISYSILHDVSLGLCYLHSQTPTIIHRDLSSNNVLLTANMTAKISDLGVARILNLTPLQISRMTQTPGTPAYLPPELMIANPNYDISVDQFSYGIMMIHMFSGRWPEPQVGPNRFEGDQLIPVTEAERREVFLRAIGNDHPVMDLILRCINNDPRCRAHASELVERLSAMKLQFPASFANRLEMLRQTEHQEEEKQALRVEREVERQRKEQEISSLRKEAEEKEEEYVRRTLACSNEVEQLKLLNQDLNSQKQLLAAKNECEATELKIKLTVCETQIESNDTKLSLLEDEISRKNADLSRKAAYLLSRDAELSRKDAELSRKDAELSRKNAELSSNVATIKRKESELEAYTVALEEKNVIISRMSEQLTRIREHLSSMQQVSREVFFCCIIISYKYTMDDNLNLSLSLESNYHSFSEIENHTL